MGTPAQNLHAYNNTKRHRTPRIVVASADVGMGGSINVTFDRNMDIVPATFPDLRADFLFCDGVNGETIRYSTEPGWSDARSISVSEKSRESGYVGPSFVRYMGGNVRANARYPLLVGERSDRVEFI